MPTQGDEIIPLSRFRAALARARRGHRADAILSDPAAAQLVPQLPVQELFYAIHEVGLADAHDLVALCTPEQIQGFVDLDCWSRDQLDDSKLGGWLDVMVTAGPRRLLQAVKGLDPELVSLYLQRRARIYDLTLGDPVPDEPEGRFWPSPDGFFMVDVLPGGEEGKGVERLLDHLFRADLEWGRRLLVSTRPQLASELEEQSYAFRAGRMSDLGYVPFEEALELWAPLDPASVQLEEQSAGFAAPAPGEPTSLPPQLAAALPTESLLARALGQIRDEPELERLQASLMRLLNMAMAADRVEPGDVAAAQTTLARAVGCVSLGLDYLGKGDEARAAEALRRVAMVRLFRVGASLTLKLQGLADTLWREGFVALPGQAVSLLDPPHDALMVSLRQLRPSYARELDGGTGSRPFESLRDVGRAAAALEEASRAGPAVLSLAGVTREELVAAVDRAMNPKDTVRFSTLRNTVEARRERGIGGPFAPLHPREARELPAGSVLVRYSWLK